MLELILLVITFSAIILDKALLILSPKELKRRARSGHDPKAGRVYKMTAYGRSLSLLLWIKGVVAAAILFIILAGNSWLIALIFILVVGWALRGWQPTRSSGSWIFAYAAAVGPAVAWVMSYLQPVLSRLEAVARPADRPEDIYEKEDLQEFINRQNTKADNRIPETDLKMAFNALTFGDKKIGDIMTPLRKVRMVAENEQVGPLLMDELHSTGFSRFPVTEAGDKANIIGTLYIKDLLEKNDRAQVADVMDKKVYFVNETQNLREALNAFLKTHHHLFIVVNSFEETVGVVTIEDILEQILGQEIVDEFDRYDDLRAVAAKEAAVEHKEHRATHPEPATDPEPAQ